MKKTIKKICKKTPNKLVKPVKEVEVVEPVIEKVVTKVVEPVIEKVIKSAQYKEEIIVAGKKVKRLNDGRDYNQFFHCSVNSGEYTGHFEKELFIIK